MSGTLATYHAGLSEKAWQDTVEAALTAGGWRWHHNADSRRVAKAPTGTPPALARNGVGFPDLIAVRGRRALAIELKTISGRVAPEQFAWLDAFLGAGMECYVWRPTDRAAMEAALAREAK